MNHSILTQEEDLQSIVLLCECAGTMTNIDFDDLESYFSRKTTTLRDRHWCSREGQARILRLWEEKKWRRLVFAGCSQDFANRRFHRFLMSGLWLDVVAIREGCSWVHHEDSSIVTGKARQMIESAWSYMCPRADRTTIEQRTDGVLVIGGGIAGTQAAIEIARLGHRVELVEESSFLGGRAAKIGNVFPTNDCGQCLPTTDAQLGTRKCFHRNLAIDHPNLNIHRRTTVQSISGSPGNFQVSLRRLPNIVTSDCINCGKCEEVCTRKSSDNKKAIFSESYDGRVNRTIDLNACSFCGACVKECPVNAIDFSQSPRRVTVNAGAALIAIGCRPAPAHLLSHLGYGRCKDVITQSEFTRIMDDWEAMATIGHYPAKKIVMIQCAGSRDRQRLYYCSRLCCMIALKHARRLRTLFPEMSVCICYMELTTPGFEKWYLAARLAGVEFIRGLPSEVQIDEHGRPVIEVEDMTSCEKRVLQPDLVILSNGMVPAETAKELSQVLQVNLDEDGFIDILDHKNRATETKREGVFVCGSAARPKAIVECNTEASAVASKIHDYILSSSRLATRASDVTPAQCTGCGVCTEACPYGAITLKKRPENELAPEGIRSDSQIAVINQEACHACGICVVTCPELAIKHYLDDKVISGRLGMLTKDTECPVVGFYCRECAGVAISLSGMRRDNYPVKVRLVELPCLGRISALHIVEAARLGASGIFLAGCAKGRCQFRKGDRNAENQIRIAQDLFNSMAITIPIELWRLCAVDRHSLGQRIRLFCAMAEGSSKHQLSIDKETKRIIETKNCFTTIAPDLVKGTFDEQKLP